LSFFVVETNVEFLLTVNLITILARGLSDLEGSDLTVLLLVLGNDTVATFGLDPVLGPLGKVQLLLQACLIVALLQAADEVRQRCVLPLEFVEVNLETLAESVPSHQVDELLNQS